jgi:hypothetical protein
MKNKKLFKLTIITGVIGLIIIFGVILSGIAYPDTFFRIATPVGFLFIFLSVILGLVSWLWYLKDLIKNKQYIWAIIVAALGLIIVIKEVIRIL